MPHAIPHNLWDLSKLSAKNIRRRHIPMQEVFALQAFQKAKQ